MSRDQKAGQNHNTRAENKSFKMAEQLKNFGTTLKNQN